MMLNVECWPMVLGMLGLFRAEFIGPCGLNLTGYPESSDRGMMSKYVGSAARFSGNQHPFE